MKLLLGVLIMLPWVVAVNAAVWAYDFGTDTGSHTAGASTTFLPAPEAGGGTARVTVGSGGGGFHLDNPGAGLGSGSELRGQASSTTSVNKFSIYGYADPRPVFSLSFTMRLSGADNGRWWLSTGTGASFSDNNPFHGSHTFAGMYWDFGPNGAIETRYRSGGSFVLLPNNPFQQDSLFHVSIYGNNSTQDLGYQYGGNNYTVAADKWDLWVNGVRFADLASGNVLAADTRIDSFMFIGTASTDNLATIRLDDMRYSNLVPEPGTLGLLLISAAGFWFCRRRHG
jgi:hypothetical protein